MKKLSGMFTNRYLLTGTPNANSVTELWHPMFLLDRGERLGPNFFHFRNSVQVSEQVGPMPNMVKWRDRPNALEAVFSLLKDVVIRHDFQAVMTHVPPNHVSRYDFDLKPGVMKQYKALEASCVLALKDGSITAVHAAALRTKLLQLASGAVYTEDGKYSVIDTQRYELGVELIEQRQHSIVFFNWRHQREQMELLLAKRGVSFAVIDGSVPQQRRDVIVNDFQAGAYQTILLHPQTGAHGLTLTRGEACILLSPIYEADLLKQAIHRIYRGAQDKATDTVLVQARGTVEDLVYERRLEKTNNMNDFLALAATAQARRS
jgi:SNF2 family DNA or RNA helicase